MLSGVNPRSLVSALPALLVAGNAFDQYLLVVAAVVAVLTAVGRVVQWSRFRWGFDGQVLHVHSGLVWRSRRAVDVARIQQVELERPLLHRALGTALLRVETAADSGETEVALNGLEVDTARSLRERISAARRRMQAAGEPTDVHAPGAAVDHAAGSTPAPPTVEVFRPSVADLARHAVTGRALLFLPAGLAAIFQFGWDLDLVGDDLDDVAGSAVDAASFVGVAIVVAVLVVVALVVAVATTLTRDWDLVLERQGDDLRLSRGLVSQRSATVPMRRLQVVAYHQNWVRRRLGVGTLHLRSAGGGAEESRRITVPWVTQDMAARVLAIGLHGSMESTDDIPTTGERHPPAARRRLWFLWLRGAWLPILLLSSGPLVALDGSRDAVLSVVGGLLVTTAALAWLASGAQYRRLGHAATDRVVLVTGGVVGRTATWMPLGRLQGVAAHANPFQRRLGLATVVLAPAGGGNRPVEIRDVTVARASELGHHLVEIAAGRIGPVDPVGLADEPGTAGGPGPSGPRGPGGRPGGPTGRRPGPVSTELPPAPA